MKSLIIALAIFASGQLPSAVIPFEYENNGIKADGVQIDYIDGTSEFSDKVTTPYTVLAESSATLPEAMQDSSLNEADTITGIVVECHHTRNWTGYYRVLTEHGELITVYDDPEDLVSSDTVTLYYINGHLIQIHL